MLPSSVAKRLVSLTLFVAFVGLPLFLSLGCAKLPPPEEPLRATVKWQEASQNALEEWTEVIGTTVPLPQRVARISTPIEGRVVSVLTGPGDKAVAEGQVVQKGSVLVQLDTTIVAANLAKVGAAQEALQHEENQAQINVELAMSEVDRLKTLMAAGSALVPLPDRIKADFALRDAKSKLEAAKSRITAGAEDVKALKAQLQLYTLTTPIRGRLGRVQVAPGQMLAAGTPVVDVIDIDDQIDVLCYIPPSMVGRFQAGYRLTNTALTLLGAEGVPEPVMAKLEEFKGKKDEERSKDKSKPPESREQFLNDLANVLMPRDLVRYPVVDYSGQLAVIFAKAAPGSPPVVLAEGEIVYVAEQAEPETGNYAVKLRFPNTAARLRANGVYSFHIQTQPRKTCVALPETAISEDEEVPTVVVAMDIQQKKNADGKMDTVAVARRMQAKLGVRDRNNHQVEILSLTDPEKEAGKPKFQIDVRSANFVVDGGGGLQTGDLLKLDVDED